jgi:ATP-dependent DNA helicase RecG
MFILSSPISLIPRLGSALAKKVKTLGLNTVEDLLFYFPFRYDDFTQLLKIKDLKPGITANVIGQIELIQNKKSHTRRMNITEVLLSDDTGTIKIIWFNQPYIAKVLNAGDTISVAGKVEDDYGATMMRSPEYEKISENYPATHTQGLIPIYHLTGNLTNKQLRFLIKPIMPLVAQVKDWLPEKIKQELKLINLDDAIQKIHFPKNQTEVDLAKKRLAFDEVFLIQLQSQIYRRETKKYSSTSIIFKEPETKNLVDSLPFKLTDAQRQSAWEILQDIQKDNPMSRLLEGDVGSGKTVTAAIAMFNVALNKKQAVLMVPTEILARQHYNSLGKLFSGWDIKIGLVTGNQLIINNEKLIVEGGVKESMSQRAEIKNLPMVVTKNKKIKKVNPQEIIDNSDIIVGTHALIQDKINFKNLGLVIIDEQHRFGVEQRTKLLAANQEGHMPHLLSMTATPIPRSLALAIYGDLDISIINEMPAGRKKINTAIVPETKREDAYKFIRAQIEAGQQVFVICPLIDLSDKLGVKSVKDEFEKLDKNIFPDLNIAMLHGKMKSQEKEKIMADFLANKIKILVSTSVIEVGVDVPNATIMMIEGAERFGLAQLHQFRGRVGRGEHQSYCFLFTENASEKTLSRLQALTQYQDGFALAKIDLRFRGPGEVFGTAQKGFPEFKIASLFDYALMKQAREQAIKLLEEDESLNKWPEMKGKIGGKEVSLN